MGKSDNWDVWALPWEHHTTRAEWENARKTFIGASEAADVMEMGRFGSRLAVYQSKIAPVSERPSLRLRRGLAMEPIIGDEYQYRTGHSIMSVGDWAIVRDAEYPMLAATPDFIIQHSEWGLGVLECKDVAAFKRDDWADGPPLYYQIQVQHQLRCTGLQWGAIAAVFGYDREDEFQYYYLSRDDYWLDAHVAECVEFWRAHIEANKPPKPDHSRASRQALRRLYPGERPGAILNPSAELDSKLVALDSERMKRKAEVRANEVEISRLDNRICAAIGTHEGVRLSNRIRYEWKSNRNGTRVLRRLRE